MRGVGENELRGSQWFAALCVLVTDEQLDIVR
jgi:hypothetical protein